MIPTSPHPAVGVFLQPINSVRLYLLLESDTTMTPSYHTFTGPTFRNNNKIARARHILKKVRTKISYYNPWHMFVWKRLLTGSFIVLMGLMTWKKSLRSFLPKMDVHLNNYNFWSHAHTTIPLPAPDNMVEFKLICIVDSVGGNFLRDSSVTSWSSHREQ